MGMGHRHEAHSPKCSTAFEPQADHHTAPPTTRQQSRQDENTVVTACAVVADTVQHRGSPLPSKANCRSSLQAIAASSARQANSIYWDLTAHTVASRT